MRVVLVLLIFMFGLGSYLYMEPATYSYLKTVPSKIYESLEEIAFEKEIRVSGTKFISDNDVQGLLPLGKSVFWWLVNRSHIVSTLKTNNYVADASLASCSEWVIPQWGCFEIRIFERKPTFLALLDEEAWLISSDGSFMFPITTNFELDQDLPRIEREYGKLKILRGLVKKGSSPDVIRARFEYTAKAIKTVERITGLKVREGQLSHNGELSVALGDPEIKARFDFSKANWDLLEEESSRLKTLLNELKGKEKEITEIDLAYERLAVVKMVSEPDQDSKSTLDSETSSR